MKWTVEKPLGTINFEIRERNDKMVLMAECRGVDAEVSGTYKHSAGNWVAEVRSKQFVKALAPKAKQSGVQIATPLAEEMGIALNRANTELIARKQAEPLAFTVETQSYFALDMSMTETILAPSKPRKFWSDEEKAAVNALDKVLGTSHAQFCDDLRAEKLDAAEGTVLSLSDVEAMVAGELETKKQEQAEAEAQKEAEYTEKLDEAKTTGKPVVLRTYVTDCDGTACECSLDAVTVWLHPDGRQTEKRVHTH